jgi:hypothetical protein
MSNRFHNKFHRHNHHTDPTSRDSLYPDSAYDPIASPESPFKGDFYLNGNLIGFKSATFGENLTINGDSTTLNTRTYITSATEIINTSQDLVGFSLFHHASAMPIAQFFGEGVRNIVFDSSNQIGVGTTSPSATLHIVRPALDGDASLVIDSLGFNSKIQLKSYFDNILEFGSFDSNFNPYTYASIRGERSSERLYIGTSAAASNSIVLSGASDNSELVQFIGNNLNYGRWMVTSSSNVIIGGTEINSSGTYKYFTGPSLYQAFLITPTGSVGINNVAEPNKTLTVNGEISANNTIWDLNGNSIQWNSTYTTVSTASANWESTYTTVSTASANWESTYTTVSTASASWQSTYTTVSTASANWESTYTTVSTASANWESTYTTVSTISATWSTVTQRLPLSGGHVEGPVKITWNSSTDPTRQPEALYVIGNVTISGNLSSTGTQYFANTLFATTSSICAINIMGTGPALYVGANGTGDIGSFYDLDAGVEVLHIGGRNSTFPHVGINTSVANKDLTVNGEISANNTIHDKVGNSTQWNSTYTTVSTTSAYWSGEEIRAKRVDGVSVTTDSTVLLTRTSLDQEITSITTGVTSISAFIGGLRGNTYTITNKATRAIVIVQSPLIFVRQGHSWRSSSSSYSNSFLTLPVSGSCSVRADGNDIVSVW